MSCCFVMALVRLLHQTIVPLVIAVYGHRYPRGKTSFVLQSTAFKNYQNARGAVQHVKSLPMTASGTHPNLPLVPVIAAIAKVVIPCSRLSEPRFWAFLAKPKCNLPTAYSTKAPLYLEKRKGFCPYRRPPSHKQSILQMNLNCLNNKCATSTSAMNQALCGVRTASPACKDSRAFIDVPKVKIFDSALVNQSTLTNITRIPAHVSFQLRSLRPNY